MVNLSKTASQHLHRLVTGSAPPAGVLQPLLNGKLELLPCQLSWSPFPQGALMQQTGNVSTACPLEKSTPEPPR
eukprot:9945807-Prorocentrum_lima.AAC.1